jgi:Protein of unknown function (DUF3768)
MLVEVAMDVLTKDKVAKIRHLNDAFRSSFRGGQILLTQGVAELPDMVKAAALHQVATFTEFTEDNDPHGEHDFLSFEASNRKFFFKIDYYDLTMEHGSEDPADPAKTKRVGTLMLSSEY